MALRLLAFIKIKRRVLPQIRIVNQYSSGAVVIRQRKLHVIYCALFHIHSANWEKYPSAHIAAVLRYECAASRMMPGYYHKNRRKGSGASPPCCSRYKRERIHCRLGFHCFPLSDMLYIKNDAYIAGTILTNMVYYLYNTLEEVI